MEDLSTLHSAPINWSSFLKQVIIDYETPPSKGLVHGLQKDAIQNGWGARKCSKGTDWSFHFSLILCPNNQMLLIMYDQGTTGLIGKVYDHATQMETLPNEIPPNEKLARFECMFDSGGGIGPGLFGRGKLLFNVVSKKHLIYYESYTVDGDYRFGKRHIIGRNCEQYHKTLEGDLARHNFKEVTQGVLKPLEIPGTRIIVIEPINDVIDAIKTGNFIKYIEETWWEIILKYNAEITVTDETGNVIRAQIPKEFNSLPSKNIDGWRIYKIDNEPVELSSDVIVKIKHLHFLLPPIDHQIPEELRGINVHRKGMKIGILPLSGIPDEISDRLFGYIQLDDDYEELVKDNITHYDFTFRNKQPYRRLRETAQYHMDLFMQELGYRKSSQDPNEKTKRLLEEARLDLDSILSGLGVLSFGMGQENEPGVNIYLKDLILPPERNYIKTGETISNFWYSVTNTLSKPKNIKIKVSTREKDIGQIELLYNEKIKINPNKEYKTKKISFTINEKYPCGKKINCIAEIFEENEKIIAQKSFYLNIEFEPPKEEKFTSIILKSAVWPRTESHRVDYNQSIQNLIYEIENLTPIKTKMRIKIKNIWAAEKDILEEILESEMELDTFETKLLTIEKIELTKDKYSELRRGKVILRCHAVALEATSLWEKATRLAEHNLPFYLNMDPSYGFFDEPTYFDGGKESPRSEAQPLEGNRLWEFRINNTHPAFIRLQTEDDEQKIKNYIFEEMARQTIFVLLRKNEIESIRKLTNIESSFDMDNKEPDELLRLVVYPATDKIIAEYYGG
jgi:hypothetical protein